MHVPQPLPRSHEVVLVGEADAGKEVHACGDGGGGPWHTKGGSASEEVVDKPPLTDDGVDEEDHERDGHCDVVGGGRGVSEGRGGDGTLLSPHALMLAKDGSEQTKVTLPPPLSPPPTH